MSSIRIKSLPCYQLTLATRKALIRRIFLCRQIFIVVLLLVSPIRSIVAKNMPRLGHNGLITMGISITPKLVVSHFTTTYV